MLKSQSLSCTDENLLHTYQKDTIKRNAFLHRFVDLLSCLDESTIIALDGSWGSGKTFFVNQVRNILESKNPYLNKEDNPRAQTLKRFSSEWDTKHRQKEPPAIVPHVCVYYDAWAHDADGDPLLSLISDIYSHVETDYSFKEIRKFREIMKEAVQVTVPLHANLSLSVDPLAIANNVTTGSEELDKIVDKQKFSCKVHAFLDSIIPEKGDRLVIFIDELDRCNPAFAIRLLERIKHYFTHEKITFVISVDTAELQATVKQYYGSEFNASKYLDRFFDLRMGLPPINTENYISDFNLNKNQYPAVHAVVEHYGFQMREITRYIRLLKIASRYQNYAIGFENETAEFCYGFVVPVMIGLRLHDAKRYNDFVCGRDPEPLYILASHELDDFVFSKFLIYRNDYPVQNGIKEAQKHCIDEVYYYLFPSTKNECIDKKIGKLDLRVFIIDQLQEIACLLSNLSNYND